MEKFPKFAFWFIPFLIPFIVGFGTWAFYPCCYDLLWIPLLFVYWLTIWTFIIIYQKKIGCIFTPERFTVSLKLNGNKKWLQYLLLYGNLTYMIPLYIINYLPSLSLNMFLVILGASIINGPTEEIYWRACLDEAGKRANVPEKKRLIFAPIAFSLWHTSFVIHLYPHDSTFFIGLALILITTWASGIIWLWVLHKSNTIFPQIVMHSIANICSVFPMLLITIIRFFF